MTIEATMAAETATKRRNGAGRRIELPGAVAGAVHEVRTALEGVGRSMPEVVRVSRSAVGDVLALIESGSNERLSAGVTLSLGVAMGMLIGGAPRPLIAIALAPVAAMGIVLADRRAVSRARAAGQLQER